MYEKDGIPSHGPMRVCVLHKNSRIANSRVRERAQEGPPAHVSLSRISVQLGSDTGRGRIDLKRDRTGTGFAPLFLYLFYFEGKAIRLAGIVVVVG